MTKTMVGTPDPEDPRKPEGELWKRAVKIAEEILAANRAPQLEMPQFRNAVLAWARAEARVQLLQEWLDSVSLKDATATKGASRSPLELVQAAEEAAERRRAQLGLDPASWARIQRDLGVAGRGADDAVQRLGKAARESVKPDMTPRASGLGDPGKPEGSWVRAYGVEVCLAGHAYVPRESRWGRCPICGTEEMTAALETQQGMAYIRRHISAERRKLIAERLTEPDEDSAGE